MILSTRQSPSNASLERNSPLLWMVGLWITPNVSTSVWVRHAPIRVSSIYSKISLRVWSCDSLLQRSWCHTCDFYNHLIPDDARRVPALVPFTVAFGYMQWFYNVSHPYLTHVEGVPPWPAHKEILKEVGTRDDHTQDVLYFITELCIMVTFLIKLINVWICFICLIRHPWITLV